MFARLLGCWLWLFGLFSFAPAVAQEAPALRLAVHPYASTLALINTHRPLQQHLAARLGQKVEFYTAPSFDGFFDTLMAGGYDIAISPPHFAVMAMEQGYVPLVRYRAQLEPILPVLKESNIRTVQDLRGKRIAMADRTAIIRLVAIKWLADQGLEAGRDFQIVERPSHGATVAATIAGEADAGLATASALKQLPADIQQQVRSIHTGQRFPHLFTMAHRRLGEERIARLREALEAFPETEDGRLFMARSAFLGYERVSGEDVRSLKPYVDLYRKTEAGR